jgi:hypothetical protein
MEAKKKRKKENKEGAKNGKDGKKEKNRSFSSDLSLRRLGLRCRCEDNIPTDFR